MSGWTGLAKFGLQMERFGANTSFGDVLHLERKERWFKSRLCNQLFIPVNKFPIHRNHPNL